MGQNAPLSFRKRLGGYGRQMSMDPLKNHKRSLSLRAAEGYPSQLWIRMQFAPELEEPQAFNWFADELVLVVLVVVGK